MPDINYGEFEKYAAQPSVGSAEGVAGRSFQPAVSEGTSDIAAPSAGQQGYWTDPIPSLSGFGSGALTFAGTGNPYLAVGAAGAGQGAGEFLRQRLNQTLGMPYPQSPGQGGRQMLDEAMTGAASELGGQVIGGSVLGPIARRMMSGAVGDPVAAETAMQLRGSVGKRFGRAGTALPRAKAQMDAAAADLERLITSAEQSGAKADPREFEKVLMDRVRRAQLNRTGQPGAVNFWQAKLARWREQWNLHPTNPNATVVQVRDPQTGRIVRTLHKQDIGIRDLNALKQENATLEARLSKARKQTGGDRKTTLDEAFASDLAKWARTTERRLVPGQGGRGLEEANQRYSRYKRLHDVASEIENPRPGTKPGDAPPLTVMGTSIPKLSPGTSSRAALALTSPLAGLAARAATHTAGRALRGPASFYDIPVPYAYPSPSGNLAPGTTVNVPDGGNPLR